MKPFDKKKINWDSRLVGSAIFVLQLPFLSSTLEFRLYSIRSAGEVVKLNYGGFHSQIAFTTRDGQRVTFAGSTMTRVDIGDRVEIRYRLATPRHARIDNILSLYGLYILPALVGLIYIVGGLFGMKPSNATHGSTDARNQ